MSRLLAAVRPSAEPSDEDLVHDLARGAHEALGALYARYAGLVFQIANHSLGAAAAEEIVQETFLAVWRGAASFDPSAGPFRPWLLRLAHWRILNELRRRMRRPVADGDEPLESLADLDPSPEEHASQGERARVIQAALATLSPKQRQAVALAFMEDMSHAEVAAALGIPLGTAKARIRDGILHLRVLLLPLAATLVLVAGVWRLVEEQRQLQLNQRAVAILTSSEALSIRVPAVTPEVGEMHGTYHAQPGTDLAVFSVSHVAAPPSGSRYSAFAQINGQWLSLGTFDSNTVLIAQGADWATPPQAIEVRLADRVILAWQGP